MLDKRISYDHFSISYSDNDEEISYDSNNNKQNDKQKIWMLIFL